MRALRLAKAFALGALLALCAPTAPAQTEHQLAEMHLLTEQDWTDTLDYGEWLLNAQFWLEHSDSQYAKDFFADLHLAPADDATFRTIVRDFTQRHDQLLAESYAKLGAPEWTIEDQTKLVTRLVDVTHDAIKLVHTNLSTDGATSIDGAALHCRCTDPL